MVECNKSNRHYIPKWLLEKFRQPLLFELDITAGSVEQRNPQRAGSAEGLWPQDIEDSLSVHDNQAARIFREKIWGRKQVALSDSERFEFALWLSQFGTRVPNTREDLRLMLEQERENPQITLAVVQQGRSELLEIIRDRNPELYDETVKSVGKGHTEQVLITRIIQDIVLSERFPWPSPEDVYHLHMRSSNVRERAHIICTYDWCWLRSNHPFVIGDNPVVRWNTKRNRWNYGIARTDVEITVPLSLNLCLLLRKAPRIECDVLLSCDARITHAYNCRQCLAATRHVYANSSDTLRELTTIVRES